MDVNKNNSADGTPVGQYTPNGATSQRFKLERVKTFGELKTKFPNNRYWNHVGKANDPDSTTASPCPTHNNLNTCNAFTAPGRTPAYQCVGYSNKLAYEIYGQTIWSWSQQCVKNQTTAKNYLNNTGFKAGDIVRWKTSRGLDGHQIMITGYNSNTQVYTYTDCNSNGTCIIKWGQTITKSELAKIISGYHIAPHCTV